MEWNGVDPDWAHGMYLLKGKLWAFSLSSLNFGKELFLDSSVQSLVAVSQRGAFGKVTGNPSVRNTPWSKDSAGSGLFEIKQNEFHFSHKNSIINDV